MGDVVVLPVVRIERCPLETDARSVLIAIARSMTKMEEHAAVAWTDWLMSEMAARGFAFVSVEQGLVP